VGVLSEEDAPLRRRVSRLTATAIGQSSAASNKNHPLNR
jgi:hypothetical protein